MRKITEAERYRGILFLVAGIFVGLIIGFLMFSAYNNMCWESCATVAVESCEESLEFVSQTYKDVIFKLHEADIERVIDECLNTTGEL